MSDSNSHHYEDTARPKLAGLDPSQVSSNQSNIPMPLLIGEGMGGVHWFCPPYGLRAVAVQPETPSKK